MIDQNRTELLYKPSGLSLTAADNKPRCCASEGTDAFFFVAEPHSSFHEIIPTDAAARLIWPPS
jgi:hypothetical protein